jgi:hypothetical protein
VTCNLPLKLKSALYYDQGRALIEEGKGQLPAAGELKTS